MPEARVDRHDQHQVHRRANSQLDVILPGGSLVFSEAHGVTISTLGKETQD
jgi:hypothetical protein